MANTDLRLKSYFGAQSHLRVRASEKGYAVNFFIDDKGLLKKTEQYSEMEKNKYMSKNTTCLIIDDEKLARELLTEFLESFPEIELAGEASNGTDAVALIDKIKPDLIFLDVQMPGMTGFDVLDEIDHEPYVIFTTAYDQYAIQAFEKNAVDYLLKPLDAERFKIAVDRALKRKKMEAGHLEDLLGSLRPVRERLSYESHIFVQKSEKLFSLPVEEILHLEASGDYTIITTKADQFVSSSGMENWKKS